MPIEPAAQPPDPPSAAANPYTRWLRGQAPAPSGVGPDPDVLIAQWDRLERLVIDVFRRGEADGQDEAEWQWLRQNLGGSLDAQAMAPHWQGVLAGGQPLDADPFAALLGIARAELLVDNRRAMQLLPAAREALNRWLLAASGAG